MSDEKKETPPAPAGGNPLVNIAKAIFNRTTNLSVPEGAVINATPAWLRVLAMFFRIIWPMAMLGGGIALFCVIGANGWLWLAIGLIIVCGIVARPPS